MADSNKKVVITAWDDNKDVLMLSNYICKDPVDACERFDREAGSKIDTERLASVASILLWTVKIRRISSCHSTKQSIGRESGIMELRFTHSAWQYATLG